jgi:hypothetical protein
MSHIVRIRTRETLLRPEVASFFMRAAHACGYRPGAGLLAEVAREPGAEWLGLFAGFDGEPKAMVLGQLPASAFHLAATIHFAYAERAPRQLVAGIGERLRSWFQNAGVDRVLVINLRHTDRAFIKGLGHFGRGQRLGSVIGFRFE